MMLLYEFLFKGLSGFLFACLCLAVLVFITFAYIWKYERARNERDDMLDKQELYRRMKADKLARIADGVEDWDE